MRIIFIICLIVASTACGQKRFNVFRRAEARIDKSTSLSSKHHTLYPCNQIEVLDSVSVDTTLWYNQYLLKVRINDSNFFVKNVPLTRYRFDCKQKDLRKFSLLNKGSVFYKEHPLDTKSYTITHEIKFYNCSIDEAYFLVKYFYDDEHMVLPLEESDLKNNVKVAYRRKNKGVVNLKLVYEYEGGSTTFLFNKMEEVVRVKVIFSPD